MARLSLRARILEVGAGEGNVAGEMARRTGRRVFALDPAPPDRPDPGVAFLAGDARRLPFRDSVFDAVAFHFVLLWLSDPEAALREARRVLRPGGVLMILSEPDLRSRREDPDSGLGAHLAEAVRGAGGHPDAGARIEAWLPSCGFRPDLRRTPGEWVDLEDPAEWTWELAFLEASGTDPAAVSRIREVLASAPGLPRVLLPVTYGIGR